MSAVLQIPTLWATKGALALHVPGPLEAAVHHLQKRLPVPAPAVGNLRQMPNTRGVENLESALLAEPQPEPFTTFAFYRKHTENLLRRYLYASMQVGRSPSLLGESVGRGWVSNRKVRTFEDALIFVLDIERCLKRLSNLDRQLISRILLQEYTQTEAAALIGISVRTICTRLPQAIDRLTESLVEADLLILPI